MKLTNLILTLFTLAGCSSRYEKVDGRWIYVSFDEAAGKRVKQLNVDNDTFHVLGIKSFAKDDRNVYLRGRIIDGADPETFEFVNEYYTKDKRFVYIDHCKLIGADPTTFQQLKYPYSKDDKNVFCGTVPLKSADLSGIEVVSGKKTKLILLTEYFIEQYPNYSYIDAEIYKEVVIGEGRAKTKYERFDGHQKID